MFNDTSSSDSSSDSDFEVETPYKRLLGHVSNIKPVKQTNNT
jgi:hypothetical protein